MLINAASEARQRYEDHRVVDYWDADDADTLAAADKLSNATSELTHYLTSLLTRPGWNLGRHRLKAPIRQGDSA